VEIAAEMADFQPFLFSITL